MAKAAALVCIILLAVAAPAPSVEAPPATTTLVTVGTGAAPDFWHASDDGTRVVFGTPQSLLPGDRDSAYDFYLRAGDATTLVGIGPLPDVPPPVGGSTRSLNFAASASGTRLYFSTDAKLVASDTDSVVDVYKWEAGATSLVSTGQYGSSRNLASRLMAISADGTHVFFETSEKLATSDDDLSNDIYESYAGGLRIVSQGPVDATQRSTDVLRFEGASGDGGLVVFESDRAFVTADRDNGPDLYQRVSGTTSLVSRTPAEQGWDLYPVVFQAVAGNAVFFDTRQPLLSSDVGGDDIDLYRYRAGVTTLVSPGDTEALVASSTDGDRVIVSSWDRLTSADTDTQPDLYQRRFLADRGIWVTTRLLTPGTLKPQWSATLKCASANGSRVVFTSSERLVEGDDNDVLDLYSSDSGFVKLLSGSSGADSFGVDPRVHCSADATKVAFSTKEPLVTGDTDTEVDVYIRSGDTTIRLSRGPSGGNLAFPSELLAITPNGEHVIFSTRERLVPADTDSSLDVYRASL